MYHHGYSGTWQRR